MSSEDDSSDSQAVQRTLWPQNSDPHSSPPPPDEIPQNVPISTFTDIDSSMQGPSHVEATPTTTSVTSQPSTPNQAASVALQRLHDYIDSQLTSLVEAAVQKAVGNRYNQLADSLNEEIVSIKNQVLQPIQDEDDPMLLQDNSADADDESEVDDRINRRGRRQAANTKAKRNCHNRRQTDEEEQTVEEEDDNDNRANNGRKRKGPFVLTVTIILLSSYLNLLTQTYIVCPSCISSTEGTDGKGGVGPPKRTLASMRTCP